MKFLTKNSNSQILEDGLTYKKGANNSKLKKALIDEQRNFCAYTEKYFSKLDSVEVEHFNRNIKYNDDYYNYYAVLRESNLIKREMERKYPEATFFINRFFQDSEQFNSRIKYQDGYYIVIDENDKEANELIEFLGFNHPDLYFERKRYILKMRKNFEIAKLENKDIMNHFKEHKEDLNFITALEAELGLSLIELLDAI